MKKYKLLAFSYWLLAFSFLFFSACKKETVVRKLTPAFYHWKTDLKLTATEINYLAALKVKKLYLRFFDVDWDFDKKKPIPLAPLNIQTALPKHLEIIPTVFITNRTLLHLEEKDIPNLCEKIKTKIFETSQQLLNNIISEVQFDCDWSGQTKTKYFQLLKCLKEQLKKEKIEISSTIRLHQVKFFQRTGVPPVDRGILMFYNMGDLNDINIENSILDLKIAKQYLHNFKNYPLDLDIALPVFAWGVLIRDNKMIKLINNLNAEALVDTTRFLKLSEHHYQLKKSTYLQAYYLYKGDIIRLEDVAVDKLEKAINLLKNEINNKTITLSFYHLDSLVIKRYPFEDLENVCKIWKE